MRKMHFVRKSRHTTGNVQGRTARKSKRRHKSFVARVKLIILIFFVMLTNPVSSHALARAAHTIGTHETADTVIDQLDSALDKTGKDTTE